MPTPRSDDDVGPGGPREVRSFGDPLGDALAKLVTRFFHSGGGERKRGAHGNTKRIDGTADVCWCSSSFRYSIAATYKQDEYPQVTHNVKPGFC